MRTGRRRRACLFAAALIAVTADAARGQSWSIDVSTGRIVYDPIAAASGTNNLVGTVRYDAPRDGWLSVTAAAPLRAADPIWGAAAGGRRLLLPGGEYRAVTGGVDLGSEGFLFRDAVSTQTGKGGTVSALPFVRLGARAASIEARGGWRGYAVSQEGVVTRRSVIETGIRASYESAAVRGHADLRWVRAREGSYPFLGGSVAYSGSRGQIWGQVGRWLDVALDDVTWGTGASVALGNRATVWVNLRHEAPDPLYWNAARRTWSIGMTHRLGRAPVALRPTTPTPEGDVLIRLPITDAPRTALFIAGDFTNWQPRPMRRDGPDWVIRLPLTAGVYNYAFRGADGEWFVPSSVPGRRDDGMGGQVAVLVVQ